MTFPERKRAQRRLDQVQSVLDAMFWIGVVCAVGMFALEVISALSAKGHP